MIPLPYEKTITSQNGEDGIIEKMIDAIKDCNNQFVEIGWGDGLTNMTRNLMIHGWSGVGVDVQLPHASIKIPENFTFYNMYVKPDNVHVIFKNIPKVFDFFSLDIDSYDYEIASSILRDGYRPKIVCVEINAMFGPYVHASFPYKENTKTKLYRKTSLFGTSIQKYKDLWKHYGYNYFGYDSSATNVFFYHPGYVNDLSYLPIHTDDEFPYKNDQIMKNYIQGHEFWSQHENEIYNKEIKI